MKLQTKLKLKQSNNKQYVKFSMFSI